MTASALYAGSVVHRRLRPKTHSLNYRVFWVLADLEELPQLDRSFSLFGHNRFSLFGFYDRDHGDGSQTPLRQQVEAHLQEAGIEHGGPIRLLSMPRILGYAFNPISVYFCHRPTGALSAILYEVNNTFGQRHTYLAPVGEGPIKQTCAKTLYVSPFNDMKMSYEFRVSPPGNAVAVAIDVLDGAGLLLSTALSGRKRDFSDRALLRLFLSHPLLTLKVVAGIHWEALRLWLKGMKITDRPPEPDRSVTVGSIVD
jgi:DUF1365 family protein